MQSFIQCRFHARAVRREKRGIGLVLTLPSQRHGRYSGLPAGGIYARRVWRSMSHALSPQAVVRDCQALVTSGRRIGDVVFTLPQSSCSATFVGRGDRHAKKPLLASAAPWSPHALSDLAGACRIGHSRIDLEKAAVCTMLGILILLFCVVPFVELYLLFALSGEIGAGWTLMIVVSTGVVGASLARMQGFQVLQKIQTELSGQRMPTISLVDAAMILVAGALLLTPGILTDLFGFSLLIPPIRAVYRRGLIWYFRRHVRVEVVGTHSQQPRPGDQIIEAKVISRDDTP